MNSDKDTIDWLANVDEIQSNGSIIMEDNLLTQVVENNKCVVLSFHKEDNNVATKLTSWDCKRKTSFICLLDESQFTEPIQLTKFPCISQKKVIRPKREVTVHEKVNMDDNITMHEEVTIHEKVTVHEEVTIHEEVTMHEEVDFGKKQIKHNL